ncbi:unnamed protein product [Heligmosomoides polygyrus]|uniref:Uncharacterized protein n=1 Tax=Heligmosomoides polygyrus TaxID=6339 RepID=A0A183FGK2_HELPZ|nr:unnamed protein product [Heligmosomoides polygyrus]
MESSDGAPFWWRAKRHPKSFHGSPRSRSNEETSNRDSLEVRPVFNVVVAAGSPLRGGPEAQEVVGRPCECDSVATSLCGLAFGGVLLPE